MTAQKSQGSPETLGKTSKAKILGIEVGFG